MLDMTKAYDKVQHNILLTKLYGIGIRGMAHNWFGSYLKNREQYVEIEHFNHDNYSIENVRSDCKIINSSIPQGSVTGCLLFLIYINDLPKQIDEPCVLFADDISLLISSEKNENLDIKLNQILQSTDRWLVSRS